MIDIPTIQLPEVVPQADLLAWRASIRKQYAYDAPIEVKEFIEALAAKLPDYGRTGNDLVPFTGYELQLSGIKELGGEEVVSFGMYNIEVPRLAATDEALTMYRIFQRKGKKGLIDYCKAKVKGTQLQRVLYILEVEVFHNNGNPKVFISSADWMVRNLDHRVEAACPILDPVLKQEIIDIINIQLRDNVKARLLTNDLSNDFVQLKGKPLRSQQELYHYLLGKSTRKQVKNK